MGVDMIGRQLDDAAVAARRRVGPLQQRKDVAEIEVRFGAAGIGGNRLAQQGGGSFMIARPGADHAQQISDSNWSGTACRMARR